MRPMLSAQAGRGVMLLPCWDERGPAESNVQVAPSLEALLAQPKQP
jgi:hypothetical protein